jgi:hypothetical protein
MRVRVRNYYYVFQSQNIFRMAGNKSGESMSQAGFSEAVTDEADRG